MVVCIICNSLVVVGIRRNSPNYLIPWLAVYIIGVENYFLEFFFILTPDLSGVLSLMAGGFLILFVQFSLTHLSFAPLIPILTAIFFLIFWWQVKNVFTTMRMDRYQQR